MCASDCTTAAASGAVRAGDSATATEVSFAMDAFFECVDAEPPAKERLAAVIAWCKSNAIANPGCLAGISDADIAAGFDGKPLAVQAFAMRSVWAATAADKAKSQKLREMLESSPFFLIS